MPQQAIAITVGDPAGIGPEISLKAARTLGPRLSADGGRLLLIGSPQVLADTATALDLPLPPVTSRERLAAAPATAILPTVEMAGPVRTGQVTGEAGRQAFDAVRRAVDLALAGDIAAIVTAPLNKEALNLAGHAYAGHTEMLADLTGVRDSVMMLAHDGFRVSHVSTHVALEDVPKRATPERLSRVIDLTHAALRRLGIADPHIAVAALNPHCGEGGIFGRHDIDVTEPLVRAYQQRGLRVTGPLPGDTIFVKLKAGQFDAVVAMYHDQGHIPVKLLGFGVNAKTGTWDSLSGVNVTLGLPIIRTSVDHGTAFDIAGKGIAQDSSLVEAVEFALRLGAAADAAAA